MATVGVADLADAGMVAVVVVDLADAGMAFPADFAGVVTVGVAPLSDARVVTIGVTGLADAGVLGGGGGSASRISNNTGPQDPGGGEARLTASWDVAVAQPVFQPNVSQQRDGGDGGIAE